LGFFNRETRRGKGVRMRSGDLETWMEGGGEFGSGNWECGMRNEKGIVRLGEQDWQKMTSKFETEMTLENDGKIIIFSPDSIRCQMWLQGT